MTKQLSQETMINHTRELCQKDLRIRGALLYGSFSRGEGDQFSDIEFAFFVGEDDFAQLDQAAWVRQIEEVELYFADDFQHHTAIFTNLVRGEFHFFRISQVDIVQSWGDSAWFPSLESTIIIDRDGQLTPWLKKLVGPPQQRDNIAQIESIVYNFLNLILFGTNVLRRGEEARALEILTGIGRYLLWMIRLLEKQTDQWPTPSKSLERNISKASYARYVSCTASLNSGEIKAAYQASWVWGKEMMGLLAQQHTIILPEILINKLDGWLAKV